MWHVSSGRLDLMLMVQLRVLLTGSCLRALQVSSLPLWVPYLTTCWLASAHPQCLTLHYSNLLIVSLSIRFTDARHHKSLLEFLQSVAVSYLKQCRAKDFVLDLLQLDVPKLFASECEGSTSTLQSDIAAGSVSDEFTTFLSEYIQRNDLRKAILANVERIWVSY